MLVFGPGVYIKLLSTLFYVPVAPISLSFILEYETFLFKFFYEFTCGTFYPFIAEDNAVSCSLPSFKNGEPALRSDVIAPFAEAPVLLPDEPKGLAPVDS